jgi:hypothetical protein
VKFRFGLTRRWRVCCICCIAVASLLRGHGAGVTLVTHGFDGNVTDWVIPMCQRIAQYRTFLGTNSSLYQVSVIQPSPGTYGYSSTYLAGGSPLLTDSGEILIALDWSTLANGGTSTVTVAARAAAALLAPDLIPALNGHALAELPLHFIGHSRGASVITEMARLLGAQGVWIDQVTTLDPHPVPEYGDPPISNYENVLYADNYWQNLGGGIFGSTAPNGQPVAGAYNRQLTALNNGYSLAHSDVHLWYHGTIEISTPASDTTATITGSMRSGWWTGVEAAGANAGFLYSAVGGGNRFSTLEPAGAGKGRIADGMNRVWDFGAGLSANRAGLLTNNGAWPNIPVLALRGTNQFSVGQPIPLTVHVQCGTNTSASSSLRFFLDPDQNPYNTNETDLIENPVAGTGTRDVARLEPSPSPNPAVTRPGTYWMGARISHGERKRYAYASRKVILSPSQERPRLLVRGAKDGPLAVTIVGSPEQRIVVEASTNLLHWAAVRTNTLPAGSWDFTDSGGLSHSRRFYRARLDR